VDDPQRKPGDRDRSALVARIRSAADQGRITSADRDIRLSNVATAQSMAELDLMSRDLDQLEAAVATAAPAAPAPALTEAMPTELADKLTGEAVDVAKRSARSVGLMVAVVLGLVLLGAGSSAFLAFKSSGDDSSNGGLYTPEPIPTATDEPVTDPPGSASGPAEPTGVPSYGLTVAGIRGFLADYQERFGTTMVVDLVLYGDYAIANVPQAGTHRHAGYLYRPTSGWTDFGGVSANFPSAQPVDLRKLDVPALVRHIAKARSTLNVEKANTTYAIVRYYTQADEVPSVDIHVANQFGESGYLATTLDGKVERAYPYAP
jgi:hypothetical protein